MFLRVGYLITKLQLKRYSLLLLLSLSYILPAITEDSSREAVHSLKPPGKTPMSFLALQVIEHLKKTGEKAKIILVTNRIEFCDGAMCEVIHVTREAGINFRS